MENMKMLSVEHEETREHIDPMVDDGNSGIEHYLQVTVYLQDQWTLFNLNVIKLENDHYIFVSPSALTKSVAITSSASLYLHKIFLSEHFG